MNNLMCDKLLTAFLILTFSSLLLTGCDTYPYKEKIQESNDYNNPTGDKAKCMMVGDITSSMYLYTTYYMQGQDLPYSPETKEAIFDRLKNGSLHLFAGIGFLPKSTLAKLTAGRLTVTT